MLKHTVLLTLFFFAVFSFSPPCISAEDEFFEISTFDSLAGDILFISEEGKQKLMWKGKEKEFECDFLSIRGFLRLKTMELILLESSSKDSRSKEATYYLLSASGEDSLSLLGDPIKGKPGASFERNPDGAFLHIRGCEECRAPNGKKFSQAYVEISDRGWNLITWEIPPMDAVAQILEPIPIF